jgi:AbrB family looped-hinge helix DNA binding protein
MKLTTEWQVTIPQKIREHLSLVANDDVGFIINGEEVILRKNPDANNCFQVHVNKKMRGKGRIKLTTDEIMRLTRGDE